MLRTLSRRGGSICALALALFASSAAAQLSGFGKNKITYREFEWKIYHSPHFDLYYYPEEAQLLEKVASFAESAYDRLSREFDHQIQDPIPLIFYATHSQFEQNNIIYNFIPEGIGAFASPIRNRMVMPVDLPDGELFELVMHELTHIFQYSILFQGRVRGIGTQPPQWFMEGMASYMAKDEDSTDRMYLRDAVVNDSIPSILERGVSGFLAYRFGHAAFDYMEERWGKEGFRDFVYEFRNTLGSRAERAVERALRVEPEEFDVDFRRWLRKKYLPQLVESGEPSDFGRPFRYEQDPNAESTSPVASPSGDLVAAFATTRGDLDIVLYDARKRREISNLTKGYSSNYQYLVSQFLTTGHRMGRDIAFSPDGNSLAVFAKRERGRSLLIFDVLDRRLDETIDMDVEQQYAPTYSPDGGKVAFSGNRNGSFDIFVLDLDTREITNLTNDSTFDGSPVFSPDGKGIVFTSAVAGEHQQLFRIDFADPARRVQLTEGEWRDRDAVFSTDGKWLFFASNRSGADNIWGLELGTGRLRQYTNAVTGCFMPTVLRGEDGVDKLVYSGFWKGSFGLYLADLEQPVKEEAPVEPGTTPVPSAEPLPEFEPDIRVSLDSANEERYGGFKLFVEGGGANVGVTDDQQFLGTSYLQMSDYLGDRRLFMQFQSIASFSNFDFYYEDRSRRWTWATRAYDDRTYFIGIDTLRGEAVRRDSVFRQTGVNGSIIFPLTFYHRLEMGAGYLWRDYDFQQAVFDPTTGEPVFTIEARKDDFPLVQAAFVGDTTLSAYFGAVRGRRYRIGGFYGYDIDNGGTIASGVSLDVRQYVPVTERSQLALRLFGYYSGGELPTPYFFGGLDTIRGFDFRSLAGDRAFFANVEFRFPLIDYIATPVIGFQGIRGRVFLDVAGAWRDYADEEFDFWNSDEKRLEDGLSSYGWGVTVVFLGLDLNWDFSKQWDLDKSEDGSFRTDFWIGARF